MILNLNTQVTYNGGIIVCPIHGRKNGTHGTFVVPNGEYITTVRGAGGDTGAGAGVSQLQFVTDAGM
jgi:hypothetical protein